MVEAEGGRTGAHATVSAAAHGGQTSVEEGVAAARFVIALDQGTTSSRAVLVDSAGQVCGVAQQPFEQHFPQPGWVEHDPFDILGSQLDVLRSLMGEHRLDASDVAAIGITNQRETTVVWDARTGLPLGPAIVWQCRRTAPVIEQMCADANTAERITRTTGLLPDAYFSASKIAWILDNVDGARAAAEAGHARFGTVDSWLVYNLTGGAVHATDVTNASRTMLFDIHRGVWDEWLCDLFGVPTSMLPDVYPSAGDYGVLASAVPAQEVGVLPEGGAFAAEVFSDLPAGIPIRGVAGDQQSALFGHCCTHPGEAKSTFGTGCFLLMHTGGEAVRSTHGLVTTIAALPPEGPLATEGTGRARGTGEADKGAGGKALRLAYALEGSVFMAGALVQWLRDELGLLQTAAESSDIAQSVDDTAGVYVVPAFTGLGAPHWDADARGAILGLTRGAGRAHVVRACLEALAYQTFDLVDAMERDTGTHLSVLSVDGGACENDFLMQFLSDILAVDVERPANTEATAMGAAFLAGLSVGFWEGMDQVRALRAVERRFEPSMTAQRRDELLAGWADAVARVKSGGAK